MRWGWFWGGFGWRGGWRWGWGPNPYPWCRFFPWLPRGWWAIPWYWGASSPYSFFNPWGSGDSSTGATPTKK